jgi:hypothetical protein
MLLKIDPNLKKFLTYELPQEQLKKMEELAKAAELSQILTAINLFLDSQSKITSSILPQLPLEIAAIKATQKFPEIPSTLKIQSPPKKEGETEFKKENISPVTGNIDLYTIKQNWNKLLTDIRPYNHSLSALLSNCSPIEIKENKIKLGTAYGFYGERLNEAKNKLTIEEVFSKILGCAIKIEVAIDKSLAAKKTDSPAEEKLAKQETLLDSALEIMGGKVVE